MSGFSFELPDVGTPQLRHDGTVQVGEFVFEADTVDEQLNSEANYMAAVLTAREFFRLRRESMLKTRAHEAARIAFEADRPFGASDEYEPDDGSPYYAMAKAILDAIDEGLV